MIIIQIGTLFDSIFILNHSRALRIAIASKFWMNFFNMNVWSVIDGSEHDKCSIYNQLKIHKNENQQKNAQNSKW